MTSICNETTSSGTATFRRVSWGAIFAGVIVTVVLQLLFTLLGVGIGAATVEPLQQSNPGKGLGVGAVIWFFVSTLIAVYIGARVAGNLSGTTPKSERMLHGILTWGTAAIAGVVFLTTAGGVLFGGAASFLGGATAMNNRNQAYANYQPTDQQQPAQTSTTVDYSTRETRSSTRDSASVLSPTGRENQDVTSQDDQRARQGQDEQRARQAGDVAARRVSQAALWSFFVLLLSGLVAALGGRGSTPAWRGVGGFAHSHAEPAKA